MTQLPRYTGTERDRDNIAAFDALRPEYRTITTRANWPLTVRTRTTRPVEVRVAQAYQTTAPTTALDVGNPHWLKSNDVNEPGIVIYGVSGLTAGTDYTLVLRIEGGS